MSNRRLRCLLLVCLLLFSLSGCKTPAPQQGQKQYNATFLTLFDTVTTITGLASSEEEFQIKANGIRDELEVYHQLFDIYNEYDGIANLKTVNDQAGIAPVRVDEKIIRLLLDCREYYELTGGKVNVAMGSVLGLWHDARTDGINDPVNARLPDPQALEEAKKHTDFNTVIIDEEAMTVFVSDPDQRLDVGAVAKGWAAQRVAKNAPEGLLISVGGNICPTGPKTPEGNPWVVGIQSPEDTNTYLHTLYITEDSLVTSGDYQRYYVVDGKPYHHIIDPDTLYPAAYWRSVTIVCGDSGLADALSTALFLLPRQEGQALLDECGAKAMWVDAQGGIFYSPGLESMIRT